MNTEKVSFVEEALRLSGKSEDEAKRTGKLDTADEQVESLFLEKHRTTNSPVHRAIWDNEFPVEGFFPSTRNVSKETRQVMSDSLSVVKGHKENGTFLNEEGKIREEVFADLGVAGYWGLLIPKEYGGSGLSFAPFAQFLTQMATVDPTIAGLASIHGCIGAVDPLIAFGNKQQKEKYLPLLASGEKLSAFALTEPGAGSDLTALKTTATLNGDHYLINGEKLFISNVTYGRLIGLVALVDNKPAVFIVEVPESNNETFQIKEYGIYALKYIYNRGLVFKDFKVPVENLLVPDSGDGLTIAYHGLNRGRISLCANASGAMRMMLSNILPWGEFRKTYGQAIDKRELVQRRIGEMAGLIVSCDALAEWGGWLLDEGYRGEMECIIAKIFGSEAQKHAAIELFMKTHGGRSFLAGHILGDHVHEFLAPCIYEGEGEMLGMAFFKSLVKEHGSKFFEPVGKALVANNIKKFNPLNPIHLWKLRKAIFPYAKWQITNLFSKSKKADWGKGKLEKHADWASSFLQKSKNELDSLMRRHELKLPDRQYAISELSDRIQKAIVVLITATWAMDKGKIFVNAADISCRSIMQHLDGRRPDAKFMRDIVSLGKDIISLGKDSPIVSGIKPDDILMKY